MNPLCINTQGYIPNRTPLSINTLGYLGCNIEESGSAGGNYARTIPYYPQDKIDYERRVQEALRRAEKKREEERQALIEKLGLIEDLRAEAGREQIADMELQVLIIKEALLHVEQELEKIEEQRADIARLARILKDDEEIMVILS